MRENVYEEKSLYIQLRRFKRKDNTLRFTTYDNEKRDVPIERISDIYVMSELSFNTKFINFISQYGIPMHFLITIIFIQEVIIHEKIYYLGNY